MHDGLQKKEVYFSEHILTCDTDWPASFRYVPLHGEIYSCKNTLQDYNKILRLCAKVLAL